MIYGFDDNKNRVEAPDANFKIVNYAYDVVSNSSDNPLTLNVGEAVITISFGDFAYGNIHVSEIGAVFVIVTIPRTLSGNAFSSRQMDGYLLERVININYQEAIDKTIWFNNYTIGVSNYDNAEGRADIIQSSDNRYFILRIA